MRWVLLLLAVLAAPLRGVAAPLTGIAPAPLAVGIAHHYELARTFPVAARVHGLPDRTATLAGWASTFACSRVDTARDPTLRQHPWVVWVQLQDARTGRWGPVEGYEIGDCSDPRHVAHQAATGQVVEVDPATARRYGFYWGPGDHHGDGHTRARIWGYSRL